MPAYDYRCTQCGKILTHYRSMNDEEPKFHSCIESMKYAPPTGGVTFCSGVLEFIWPVPTIKFVGSGFFINDYKGK